MTRAHETYPKLQNPDTVKSHVEDVDLGTQTGGAKTHTGATGPVIGHR